MRSGGGLLIAPVHCTHSVDVLDAVRDIGKQLGRIETPEGVLGHQQRLPDQSVRDINAPSRKVRPLQAAPGLVDGWLRPPDTAPPPGYSLCDAPR